MDQQVIQTTRVDEESPLAYFQHKDIELDTRNFSNGEHELFVQAYDVEGNVSMFDLFQAHASAGEYIPIVFTIDNPSLGLDWNEFEVLKKGKQVDLVWKKSITAQDIGFDIQRSKDGQAWENISFLSIENGENTYQYTDKQPLLGKNYYRIKFIARENNFSFSSIRSLVFEGDEWVTIYPNPVGDVLYIDWNTDMPLTSPIVLYDIMGRVVKKFELKNRSNAPFRLNLDGVSSGVYFIEIENIKRCVIR